MEKKAPNRYGKMNGTDDHGAKHDTPEANHYTSVKPLKLCRYLCRLVTPTGGVVLDPFCGSGSVGVAALGEGFGFVGVEQSAEYKAIAEARLQFSR